MFASEGVTERTRGPVTVPLGSMVKQTGLEDKNDSSRLGVVQPRS